MPLVGIDLLAPLYDRLTGPLERRSLAGWRRRAWARVPENGRGLEIGAGTGANFRYHPEHAWTVATDVSPRMLREATRKADRGARPLVACDVQALPFAGGAFDWVAETFVFCEVDDPLAGFEEIRRVLRRGGQLVMLEHVRPSGWLGRVADAATAVSAPLWGEHFDRDSEALARSAGMRIQHREYLWRDGVVLLVAQ